VIDMPVFKYEAVDERGNNLAATIEALTQNEAVEKIRTLGYFPIKLTQMAIAGHKTGKSSQAHVASHTSSKVKARIITEFARELATLHEAGLPVLRSLRSLERQE